MENLGSILKKSAIAIGVFLLLVALIQGPQEAAGMGKEVIAAVKTGLTSLVIFGREMISELKK